MTKARFIGDLNDPKSDPEEIVAFGVTFAKDQWVDDVPEAVASKLKANPHFEVDANEDGVVDEVAALRKALDDLGVSYHPRAGVAKLSDLLAEARAAAETTED